jgi:tripartite-type tricarboxylate transporter receptor subunit TctC
VNAAVKPLFAAALAFIAGYVATAAAQTYPSRPVTMIVPYPAGGPTDTLVRLRAFSPTI